MDAIYKMTRLDNGLRVVSANIPHMKSLSLGIWIKVGGRYETKKISGISHFLEHMVFKGTKKRSSQKIKESIEGIGGSLNGFTSEEFSCFLAKVPSRQVEMTFDVLSDMALNPRIDEKDVIKEKQVIIEEIKMYMDIPAHYVHELLSELMWPNKPLGMFLAGTVESVSGIDTDMLREYKRRHYHSNNIIVAAAGQVEHNQLLNLTERYFKGCSTLKSSKFKKAIERQRALRIKILEKDTEQTHISLGVHSFGRLSPYRYALSILNIILGANMSSRLFKEVREKRGLAYEIGSQLKRYQDTGAFIIHAGLDVKRTLKAVETIAKELDKIKRRTVSKREFQMAKEFYTGQLTIALEDTLDHMLWIGENAAALDRIYTLEELFRELEEIGPDDVQDVAQKIFRRENLSLAIIGPFKEKDKKDLESALSL